MSAAQRRCEQRPCFAPRSVPPAAAAAAAAAAMRRRMLLRLVVGVRWLPGLGQLAEVGFSLVEGMQGYYTYVEA